MKFLNGFKTILGVAGAVASVVLPAFGKDTAIIPAVVDNLRNIGDHAAAIGAGASAVLTILGVIHKREKAKEAAK